MTKNPSDLTQITTRHLVAALEGEPSEAKLLASFRQLAKWRAHLIENTILKKSGSQFLTPINSPPALPPELS